MAAIFQLRRGTTGDKPTLTAGELYIDQTSENLIVGVNGSKEITLLKLNDINTGSLTLTGDIRLSGSIYLGNESGDNISTLGVFTTNLVPSGDSTKDVGTIDAKWRNVYATNISGAIAATNGVISGSSQLGTIFEAAASSTHTIVSGSSQIISILTPLNSFSSSILAETASLETRAATLGTYTASVETRFTTLGTLTGSNAIRLNNLETTSGSNNIRLNNLESKSASVDISISALNSYSSSLKTAIGLSGTDVTINGNLTVAGTTTQINSTTLNIGDNIIELNYGGSQTTAGIYTKDATGGSTISGSLLWDATNDYWKAGKLGSETKVLLAGGDSVLSSSAQLNSTFEAIASSTHTIISGSSQLTQLNTTTASLNTSVSNINTLTASALIRFTNLESKSSSVDVSITNINTETASLETRATTLAGVTSSILNWTSSAKIELSNLELFSGSQLTQNGTLATLTGSYTTRFATLEQLTSSLQSATASLFLSASRMTSSIYAHEGRITYLEGIAFGGIDLSAQFLAIQQVTSSLHSYTSSANIRFSNIEAATSSYETKGRGIVSGSSQIVYSNISSIPAGIVSGAAQVTPLLPNGVISGSSQLSSVFEPIASSTHTLLSGSAQILGGSGVHSGSYTGNNNIVSGAAQIPALLPSGVISGSSQILGGSGLFSSSVQIGNYVATITGTANQIVVAGSGLNNASVTLSTPQSIATTSDVTFNNITASAGIRAVGDIIAYYSSDERLKENITPIPNALQKVELISGNTYDWKEGFDNIHPHKGNDVGVIAQEVEKVLPQVVIERDNGYKAVDYEKIVPLLIEAIKELSAKVKELENK